MLTDVQKQSIQTAYKTLIKNKGYRARYGQRVMIAEIAKTLAGIGTDAKGLRLGESHICVVEAGTGTGKTVAYMMAALPLALALKKKLVISTATIMLQEQLNQKDLPDLLKCSGLPFSYAIAKGRGRYLCMSKLESALVNHAEMAPDQALFEDELALRLDDDTLALYEDFDEQFRQGKWDGDRDSWSDVIAFQKWQRVTTDHSQCSNRRCTHFADCSYFLARQDIAEADVIVANHDLVLADLSLGGGALLPKPEETIYVFDEAHHLPDKALNHFSGQFRLSAAKQWLKQIPKLLTQIASEVGYDRVLGEQTEKLPAILKQMEDNFAFVEEIIEGLWLAKSGGGDENTVRFSRGEVPADLRIIAKNLTLMFAKLNHTLQLVADMLLEKGKDEEPELKQVVEQNYMRLSIPLGRSDGAKQLWQSYASLDEQGAMPTARWMTRLEHGQDQGDIELCSSPVTAAEILRSMLWSDCFAAVLTSATLSALNSFNRSSTRMGLPESTGYHVVPSPFDYQQCAIFEVPETAMDPRNGQEFEISLIEQLNRIIDPQLATLVIFTARYQMLAVYKNLDDSLKPLVLLQDDYSKQELVKRHCNFIDEGRGSVIFGLGSLTEGVDLPGDYVKHVIIAKLPFSVPNDPVEATLTEWLEAQGRNPFWEISVPDASIKLKQACGRLLRTENDSGKITLLDQRILTKRYGKPLLDALPDYKKQLGRP
jgi:ATP-dependent DNA helicase DinG